MWKPSSRNRIANGGYATSRAAQFPPAGTMSRFFKVPSRSESRIHNRLRRLPRDQTHRKKPRSFPAVSQKVVINNTSEAGLAPRSEPRQLKPWPPSRLRDDKVRARAETATRGWWDVEIFYTF